MKKFSLLAAALLSASTAFAGGYLTNTNQSVSFVRNPARLATFELDGAYSNPAGLAWIGEGLHIGFNWQSAVQERNITSNFAPFAFNAYQQNNSKRQFNGDAKAPFIPSLDAAFQKGQWTVSGHFGVTGGGGKATFSNGLPMFDAPIAAIVPALNDAGIPATSYSSNMFMSGSQYVYGIQLGVTYKIFENRGALNQGLSIHVGARANIANNEYEGYLRNVRVNIGGNETSPIPYLNQMAAGLKAQAEQAAQAGDMVTAQQLGAQATSVGTLAYMSNGIELECEQNGFGIAPIIGLDYRIGNVNIGARYEFKTNLELLNDTDMDDIKGEKLLGDYQNGVKTPNDIPAILAVGAQWSLTPKWRIMGGWNCYFDKNAKMAGGKEKHLKHNTHEITAGMEYDVLDWLTISGGYQNTNYGTSDAFQSDMSFSCDSYLIGLGFRAKINEHFSIDGGYMWNDYKDYTKASANYQGTGQAGSDTYSRKNQVFGLGVTWHM